MNKRCNKSGDENEVGKNQKGFNSKKQFAIVLNPQIMQAAVGALIGIFIGLMFDVTFEFVAALILIIIEYTGDILLFIETSKAY